MRLLKAGRLFLVARSRFARGAFIGTACFCAVALGAVSRAATFETGSDLEIHWDNTLKYGMKLGLDAPSPIGVGYCPIVGSSAAESANAEPLKCRYRTGLNSARLDWLSQLDMDYRGLGLHASAAGWYDAVNNRENAHGASGIVDSSELGGHDIELFEAFVNGSAELGDDRTLSYRIGRHTLAWGESVFFPGNGVAAGQSPIDTYMEQSAANYQTKNLLLPVGQLSFTLHTAGDLSIEGYYQFEWRRSRIDSEASYSGANDVLGAENNRVIGLTIPGRGEVYYNRLADQIPASNNQYGLAVKWRLGDLDLGLYGLSYNAKTPNIYYSFANLPTGPQQASVGSYSLEYARGIEIYGISVAGSLGSAAFGAEISGRRNMPLVNGGILIRPGTPPPDNDRHPAYPVGDTLHAQFSWVATIPPFALLPDGASWTGEIAGNSVLRTTANAAQLTPGRTAGAASVRTVFEPQFFQVFPRVDISIPIGVGYNFLGFSRIDPSMNHGTGDIDLGVTMTVDQVWKAALTLTHYFGAVRNATTPFNLPAGSRSLSDWDFVALSIQRTF